MAKRDEILDVAEGMARHGGYNHFSFREIASEVGIKSASVHYHFPTKGDLGAELAQRYTQAFIEALGEPTGLVESGQNPIAHYASLFRKALIVDQKMCLCGMLGAEFDVLPERVQVETRQFFEKNLLWLRRALVASGKHEANAEIEAARILSLLEGAMIVSKTLGDPSVFEGVAGSLY